MVKEARIPGMNAIEIRVNEEDMVVVTQENFPDEDQTILLNRVAARELAGMLRLLGGGDAGVGGGLAVGAS